MLYLYRILVSSDIIQDEPIINKQPDRPKNTVCPKCSSHKIGIFPNCTYTFGCSDCGYAFVLESLISKGKKRYGR